MFISFGEKSPKWDGSKMVELCRELIKETKIPYMNNQRPYQEDDVRMKGKPYITLNSFYEGVFIRKITNMSQLEIEELDGRCDKVYRRVMCDGKNYRKPNYDKSGLNDKEWEITQNIKRKNERKRGKKWLQTTNYS